MNQEKIGKFILELRKDKNLTQVQLANQLGISDRTISKWENGRGLPDISILKNLSEVLDVSVNELLSGERLNIENYRQKSEENMIQTIEESSRKLKSKDKMIKMTVGLCIALIISMLLALCYEHRIYQPDLSDVLIERAIEDYFYNQDENEKKYPYIDCFVAVHLFDDEKISDDKIIAYTWVRTHQSSKQDGELKNEGGSSIPYKVTLQKNEDEYNVLKAEFPQVEEKGYRYSLNNLFPWLIVRKIEKVHEDGTITRLNMDIEKQMEIFYRK